MSQFPYTIAPGPLGDFLEKLKNVGVPDKVDYAYLSQIGFSSSNHRPFIPVLKHIELLDGSGVPTDKYRKGLRGGEAGKAIVAEGIRNGYKELFNTYPDAATRSTADLTTFVKANTDLGDNALRSAHSRRCASSGTLAPLRPTSTPTRKKKRSRNASASGSTNPTRPETR